jgi:hypothetical protein
LVPDICDIGGKASYMCEIINTKKDIPVLGIVDE